MPPSRRDFMKGLAAIAASIPVLGTTRCVVQSGPPDEPEESSHALSDPPCGGAQRHGDQPEFYVSHFSVAVETEYLRAERRVQRLRDLGTMKLDVFTEYPAELFAWTQHNPLTVEIPSMNKTYKVNVSDWEVTMDDASGDVFVSISGTYDVTA